MVLAITYEDVDVFVVGMIGLQNAAQPHFVDGPVTVRTAGILFGV